MNLFRLLLVACLAGSIGAGCGEESSSSQPPQTSPPAAVEPAAPSPAADPAALRESLTERVQAYYQDLAEEQIDPADHFAPTVDRFFSSNGVPREQIGDILTRGFAQIAERSIELDEGSVQVSQANEGYAIEFSGQATTRREGEAAATKEQFRNRVVFNEALQIVSYENLNSAQTNTRSLDPASEGMGPEALAEVVLTAFKSGDYAPLDQHIHPEMGFYFVTHPGAMSIPYLCSNPGEMINKAPWFGKGLTELEASPKLSAIPRFDCAKGFSKSGCFVGPAPADYQAVSSLMGDLNQVEEGMYRTGTISTTRELEAKVSHQVVDTEAAIAFFLGEIEGQWYLLVVDIATYDCSA